MVGPAGCLERNLHHDLDRMTGLIGYTGFGDFRTAKRCRKLKRDFGCGNRLIFV